MPKVVIAAGGTAGHVVPALAVANVLRERGAEVEFIGGERAEAELVPAAGYRLHTLRVAGIDRDNALRAARAVLLAARATVCARGLLKRAGADAVLGGGGYVAGPVGLAARSLRLPLVLTEADSHLGVTNRMLAPLAARICLAFPVPGRSGSRYLLTGRPLPAGTGAADRAAARTRFELAPEGPCLPPSTPSAAPRPARYCTPAGAATTTSYMLGSTSLAPRRITGCSRTSNRLRTRSRPPTWWRRAPAVRCSSWPRSGCQRSSCPIHMPRPTIRR